MSAYRLAVIAPGEDREAMADHALIQMRLRVWATPLVGIAVRPEHHSEGRSGPVRRSRARGPGTVGTKRCIDVSLF